MNFKNCIASLMAVLSLVMPVSAYTADGSLADWGVNPFTSWAPSSGTADYTEDNWAHGSDIGTGSMPSGGETFDMEAIYFDNKAGFAYFAVVTSMPESGVWAANYTMGDLALDLDNDGSYEYGIKILGPDKGMVCQNPVWTDVLINLTGPGTHPYTFECNGGSSVDMGDATVAYVKSGVNESGGVPETYVIEIAVNDTFVGSPPVGQWAQSDITMSCVNDVIKIDYDWDLPAFPSAAVPIVLALFAPVGAYVAAKRREEK